MMLSEHVKIVTGLAPVADAFTGTVGSDVINVENFQHVTFVLYKGVGATGTSTITVEACDDTTPSNTTAIPFRYRRQQDSDNVTGALTAATTTGFATTAGSGEVYIVEVDTAELGDTGYNYIRLKAVEVVDSPVLGGILAVLSCPRYVQSVMGAAIA